MTPPGLESNLDPAPRYLAENYRGAGELEGRAALVTGGDSGIGRSVAVLFAREGASQADSGYITCDALTLLDGATRAG